MLYTIYKYIFNLSDKIHSYTIDLTTDGLSKFTYTIDNDIRLEITQSFSSGKFYNIDYIELKTNERINITLVREKNVYLYIRNNYPEIDLKYIKEFFDFDFTKSINVKSIPGKYEYQKPSLYNDITSMMLIKRIPISSTMTKIINVLNIEYYFSLKKYYVSNLCYYTKIFNTIDEVHNFIKSLGYNISFKNELDYFENYILIQTLRGA